MTALRVFAPSLVSTLAALAAAYLYDGASALILCALLGILEVSLSFDNAVMNATILERMHPFWQRMFLTVGVLIAVFGMRVLFPLLIVWATAGLAPGAALDLALHPPAHETAQNPGYATILTAAHPQIAALGGVFLLMVFLDYLFDDERPLWGRFVESRLARIGRMKHAAVIVALVALLGGAAAVDDDRRAAVLVAGIVGLLLYLAIQGLTTLFGVTGPSTPTADDDAAATPPGAGSRPVPVAGRAAFFLFLYLEMLDASFSFDGVIGAFALTSDPIVIALGLGFIGAMFVRSITVYLVRTEALAHYRYLANGAHWAIGTLAVILLVSLRYEVNEVVTGLVGIAFIGAAMYSSVRADRADRRNARPAVR
ncbi:MAG: DUF475 domain-containing protein [Gordonia sp. (in: high G+C Gram-positive bacteria)]|uniref:DUF475 domain-containing protein n=1 Tax=Gordonia sp. (in: high G+C Gram-positive bacteria) TaxID=84139 RepID=UPI0039E59296